MYQELYNSQLERFKVSFLTAAARGGRIDEVASLIDLAAGGEDNLDFKLVQIPGAGTTKATTHCIWWQRYERDTRFSHLAVV